MRGGRNVLLWGGCCLLAAALAITAGLAVAEERAPARDSAGALAAVLLPGLNGSRIAVVDLDGGGLVRTISLRSLVTDMAVDRTTGLVVCAQSGGVGTAADDAVSLIDLRSGRVRYVTLPWPDPTRVACLDGRAFLLHSVVEPAGLAVSAVDLTAASVVATGHAPDGPGAWTAFAESLWSLALTSGPAPFELVRADPGTFATSLSVPGGIAPMGIAETSGTLVVVGREPGTGGPGQAALVGLLDAPTGGLRISRPLAGLPHGSSVVAVAGGRLIVGDWTGDEPETRALQALELRTLRPVGTIAVDGVPCALGSWEGRLLVVDREGGRLLQVDPGSGKVLTVTDLGARDLVYSRVVVLPGR
jgi:hypothetical protein